MFRMCVSGNINSFIVVIHLLFLTIGSISFVIKKHGLLYWMLRVRGKCLLPGYRLLGPTWRNRMLTWLRHWQSYIRQNWIIIVMNGCCKRNLFPGSNLTRPRLIMMRPRPVTRLCCVKKKLLIRNLMRPAKNRSGSRLVFCGQRPLLIWPP